MSDRYDFSDLNLRYRNESQHDSRRSHAERPGSDQEESPHRASRIPRDDISDSSSEEGLGIFATSHDRKSNSDSESSDGHLHRRINSMGGLGMAAEEMFVNAPARRAAQARLDARRRSEQTEGQGSGPRGSGDEVIHESHSGTEMIHHGDYDGNHAQEDDNNDHASFASDEDSQGHRLPRRRLRRQNADSPSRGGQKYWHPWSN